MLDAASVLVGAMLGALVLGVASAMTLSATSKRPSVLCDGWPNASRKPSGARSRMARQRAARVRTLRPMQLLHGGSPRGAGGMPRPGAVAGRRAALGI